MTATPADAIQIVLVMGHRAVSDVLAAYLGSHPDLAVVATAGSAREAEQVLHHRLHDGGVDVALVDLALPDADGIRLAATMRSRWPGLKVVLVAEDENDVDRAADALHLGVAGWVAKSDPAEALVETVRGVAHGDTRLPDAVLTRVLQTLAVGEPAVDPVLERLTPRELDVLRNLANGRSRQETADRLQLSPNTVRTHVQSILHKFDVHSSLSAVALARRSGFPAESDDG